MHAARGAVIIVISSLSLSQKKELTLDHRLVADAGLDLEWPVLDVGLDGRVVKLAADQPLGVEHRVDRVHRDLRLGGVADQALGVGEGDIRRRRAVSLFLLLIFFKGDLERVSSFPRTLAA